MVLQDGGIPDRPDRRRQEVVPLRRLDPSQDRLNKAAAALGILRQTELLLELRLLSRLELRKDLPREGPPVRLMAHVQNALAENVLLPVGDEDTVGDCQVLAVVRPV